MSVDVEEVNYIFMVCLYLKLKNTFWLFLAAVFENV